MSLPALNRRQAFFSNLQIHRTFSAMKILFAISVLFLFACTGKTPSDTAFSEVPRSQTGIDFRNLVIEKETFNIFKYQYFYNGGGTAIGDFNNDGLQDLVFTGNMVKNRMYLNKGDFEFQDITLESGIAEKEGWCTGATPVDINEDGWLDLYICRAGYPFDNLRSNLLFINKGKDAKGTVRFEEKSADYGLDDAAHSTQASFFDYDKDGDLDLFLLNHSTVEYSRGSLDIYQIKNKKNPGFTNKLLRNDGQKFTNITEAAGVTSNVLSFSLGIITCDLNQDGWSDVFISNDFNEPDYLFINQKDGTFKEELVRYFDHTSLFSMGCDLADIDGDALPDLVSLDMLPEGNHLQKMHSGVDNFEKVYQMIRSGFYKQYSRNMLQHNNGDGTFSEIGQFAGVSNTDWSWSSLFFDFDNDGLRDLFVSNGYPRDHTNMDFLKFTADEVINIQKGKESVTFQEYLQKMPPIIEANYFYKNEGGLKFSNQAAAWGLSKPVVTQSASWADLDNDGDLDLVLNNTNDYASILENHADKNPQNHWLRIQLQGPKGNPNGIGAKIWAYANGQVFYLEQNIVRGFQATVDPILSLGLGQTARLDSLVIVWPTDEREVLANVPTKQILTLKIEHAKGRHDYATLPKKSLFVPTKSDAIAFQHRENENNDFKRQSLLPWFYSRQGPAIAVADVNGDGLEDVFVGGANGQSGQVFLQSGTGFNGLPQPDIATDAACEDVAAAFFDGDGDGDQDLYVCSGGYEFEPNDPALQDRFYLNDGRGKFTKALAPLPSSSQPSTCVIPGDMDGDGDLDLFVGGGIVPGRYPQSAESHLLENDGHARFSLKKLLPGATNAVWLDLDNDKDLDLVSVAEWSPIRFFENQMGELSDQTSQHVESNTEGLWNTIHAADLDGDGDLDLVAGNLGLNSQLHATVTEPLELWSADFDQNGSLDPLLFYYVQGKSYPFISMEDLTGQLPYLRKKFNYFKDYADAQVGDIFTPEQLKRAEYKHAKTLESLWFENVGGQFKRHSLPKEAQFAPVEAIVSLDANHDGHTDLVLAGNRTHARVKLGNLGGNHGQLFLSDGKGSFKYVSPPESGLQVRGDVRALTNIKVAGKKGLLFGVNNEAPTLWTLSRSKGE